MAKSKKAKFGVGSRPHWTDEDNQVLLSKISNWPTNHQQAFREAAAELGRTAGACGAHYRDIMNKPNPPHMLAVASNTGIRVLNKRVTPMPKKAKTEEMRLEVWKDITDSIKDSNKRKLMVKYLLEI